MSKDGAESDGESVGRGAGERVGYKKAPVEHRFAAGQSGNPKGSSRRRRDAAEASRYLSNPAQAAILAEADRLVTVRENGREIRMTMRELVTRRLMLDATKGGATAMRLTMQLLSAAEAAKRKEFEGNVELIMHLKMDGEAALRRAKAAGKEPPLLLPHPDDIEVDPFTLEISINGPIEKKSYDQYKRVAIIRDEFFAEILSLKTTKLKTAAQKQRLAYLTEILAQTEAALPPSMKMKPE